MEQDIVPHIRSSYSTNLVAKVRLADNLLAFRFGQKYIIDAYISKFIINLERPIVMSNLFVRNSLVTNYASQHIVPFIETASDRLSQPKLFPLCRLRIMLIWVASIVSCLANIWYQMRRIFCSYFGCRNIKPGPKSSEIADSRASRKEDENQRIAESDSVKPAPLGCFVPEPVSPYRLMDEQSTFNLGIGDHVIGTSSTNPIIIIDHDVKDKNKCNVCLKIISKTTT